MSHRTEANFVLDTLIFIAFLLTALSGLLLWLLLPSGGFQGGRNPAYYQEILLLTRRDWRALHTYVGMLMMSGVVIHLALNWRWIVCTAKRFAFWTGRRDGRCPVAVRERPCRQPDLRRD